MRFIKYLSINLIVIFGLIISANAEVPSDKTHFVAKKAPAAIDITSYQKFKQQEEEERRLKEEREKRQQELLLKKQQMEEDERKAREDEIRRQKEAEQKRLEQQQKLEEIKFQQAELARHRISKYKVITIGDKDTVNLKGDRENFYMEDYKSELGTPEDTSSSSVARDKLLTTDMYVRLLTQTNINSRRAGEYVAIVEKDIFSPDTQHILIPKGSKFICEFQPLNAFGETTISSECKRVYFPNGKSVMLGSAPVYDAMGRPGVGGHLDNRMFTKYGQTLFLSVLGGVAIWGANQSSNSSINNLSQSTGLNIIDTATDILKKTVDLAPVVTIPSGTRILVKIAKDLNLKPESK